MLHTIDAMIHNLGVSIYCHLCNMYHDTAIYCTIQSSLIFRLFLHIKLTKYEFMIFIYLIQMSEIISNK